MGLPSSLMSTLRPPLSAGVNSTSYLPSPRSRMAGLGSCLPLPSVRLMSRSLGLTLIVSRLSLKGLPATGPFSGLVSLAQGLGSTVMARGAPSMGLPSS